MGINTIKIRNVKVKQPPEALLNDEDAAPFNGHRTREPYYLKDDGEITDIAKLCIDKPDGGQEVIYVVEAWLLRSKEDMKVQEKEFFESIDEAKECLKENSYKPIKTEAQIDELGLTEYIEWFYK